MNIAIICGAQRIESESGKLALFLQQQVTELLPETQAQVFDLGKNPLPFWNEGLWQGTEQWKAEWNPIAEKLQNSDGLIVISPEYGGMVPPALKNFLLLCNSENVGHKPGLIVGVSSGRGGTYPVAELRVSGYKNNRICWVPDHIIVRSVSEFNKSPQTHERDVQRIQYSLKMFYEYTKALKMVRDSGVIDLKTFPFGM